ncbi:MAG: methyltransferase [Reichenbachiella sp.]
MPNNYFQFKQFKIIQDQCAMKVSTEACILGAWVDKASPRQILDIGTGTGLLSLMLAQRYDCKVDAVELETQTSIQAKENFSNSPWRDRIRLINQDIQEFSESNNNVYDLVVCNPPFFQSSLKSQDAKNNMAKHETEYFNKTILVDVLLRLLSPIGSAFVLYPEDESLAFQKLIESEGFSVDKRLVIKNQLLGKVFRIILAISKKDTKTIDEELVIRNGEEYSVEMKDLLEDYYL